MKTRRNFATPDFQSGGTREDLQRFSAAHAKSSADSTNSTIADLVKLYQQDKVIGQTMALLSGNLTFANNFNAEITTLTWSSGIGSVQGFTHSRGVTATGFLVSNPNKWGTVINGGAWTSNYCDFLWDTNGIGVAGNLTATVIILF